MSWTLLGLCQSLEAQRKIRGEILALTTDDPMMGELKALPYLDMDLRDVCLEDSLCQGYGLADESMKLRSGAFHLNIPKPVPLDLTCPRPFVSSMGEGDIFLIPTHAMNTDRGF